MNRKLHYTSLSLALAFALSACGGGGGGGNTRPEAPPPTPPAPPPPPAVCEDDSATNKGGELPCTYRYNGRADNVLVPVNADLAHEAGFTGEGVKVGVLDDGQVEGYSTLEGRVSWYRDYTDHSDKPDPSEKHGHGAAVAAILGGKESSVYSGGVAPESDLYWGRICYDNSCMSDRAGHAVSDMGKDGVRLFNLSLGGGYVDEDTARRGAAAWRRALGQVLPFDALVVHSAGNDSTDHPANLGHVPRFYPELNSNWLTVAAIDVDSRGNTDGLSDYSNACGSAADWCVVAPGLAAVPAIPGTIWTNGGQGTSFAAPIVTGTAALVWQAFPWMSASNVQQTILTTATDLGNPGVDPTYGWGLVNADKAVRGPAQFLADGFTANVESGRYVFSNDISGEGGLTKTGSGWLTLTGDNTYRGDTVVDGGRLVARKGLPGSVEIERGRLYAGGSIAGDLAAGARGATEIQLGNPLQVTGTATLDGTLRLFNPASGYEVGDTEVLLTAKTVEGEFAEVAFGSGFFWSATVDYSDTQVVAELVRASAQGAAVKAGSAQRVIEGARQADALFGFLDAAGSGELSQLRAAAARLAGVETAQEAEAALAALTGEVHGTARAVAFQQAIATDQVLGDRIANMDPAAAGVWIAATGVDGAFDREGYADADYRQSQITFGADRRFSRSMLGGIALSTGRGRAELDALGGRFDADTDSVSTYARFGASSDYLSLAATHARSTADTHRSLLLGEDLTAVSTRRKDTTWSARVEAGRSYGLVAPFVAAGWVGHEQGAFVEAGGDGLGLAASSDDASIHYGELGVRLNHRLDRMNLRGVLAGRWTGGDTTAAYRAHFTGAPNASFEVSGQQVPTSALRAGAGVEFQSSPRVSWSLDVGGETGAGDSDNAYISGGVRISL